MPFVIRDKAMDAATAPRSAQVNAETSSSELRNGCCEEEHTIRKEAAVAAANDRYHATVAAANQRRDEAFAAANRRREATVLELKTSELDAALKFDFV